MERTILAGITAMTVMVGFQILPLALDNQPAAYAEVNDEIHHPGFGKMNDQKHTPPAARVDGKPKTISAGDPLGVARPLRMDWPEEPWAALGCDSASSLLWAAFVVSGEACQAGSGRHP